VLSSLQEGTRIANVRMSTEVRDEQAKMLMIHE